MRALEHPSQQFVNEVISLENNCHYRVYFKVIWLFIIHFIMSGGVRETCGRWVEILKTSDWQLQTDKTFSHASPPLHPYQDEKFDQWRLVTGCDVRPMSRWYLINVRLSVVCPNTEKHWALPSLEWRPAQTDCGGTSWFVTGGEVTWQCLTPSPWPDSSSGYWPTPRWRMLVWRVPITVLLSGLPVLEEASQQDGPQLLYRVHWVPGTQQLRQSEAAPEALELRQARELQREGPEEGAGCWGKPRLIMLVLIGSVRGQEMCWTESWWNN